MKGLSEPMFAGNTNWCLQTDPRGTISHISFAGFLKGHHGRALETQIGLEILSDLTDKTLEGQLADQEFGGFLVTTDLTKSHGSCKE